MCPLSMFLLIGLTARLHRLLSVTARKTLCGFTTRSCARLSSLMPNRVSGPIGRYIVEVHHAESSQRLVRVVESSAYARVDANGRRESGHHLEIDSLGRCFVRQEIC